MNGTPTTARDAQYSAASKEAIEFIADGWFKRIEATVSGTESTVIVYGKTTESRLAQSPDKFVKCSSDLLGVRLRTEEQRLSLLCDPRRLAALD
jgi:hypothetical protein